MLNYPAMKSSSFKIPEIATTEQTKFVEELLNIIQQQKDIIQKLEDEISRLKKHSTKPKISPSVLEKPSEIKPDNTSSDKNITHNILFFLPQKVCE
jgi:uncharacterized coiled-coil protein SlyX